MSSLAVVIYENIFLFLFLFSRIYYFIIYYLSFIYLNSYKALIYT